MNWLETPKKLLNRVILLSVFTLLLVPQIAFASWWNPISWFNHWMFYKTETAPQVQQAQVETPKTSKEITELQKQIDEFKNQQLDPTSSVTTPTEQEVKKVVPEAEEQAITDTLKAEVLTGVQLASPSEKACTSPITYRIDKVDSRFNISRSELQSALAEAEAIWEKGTGRDLFLYSPQGALPVSLVYDYRQATIDSVNRGKLTLEAPSAQHKSYEAKIADLRASYNSLLARHNADAEHWNSVGGAQSERARLESEQNSLDLLQKNLNDIVDFANSHASRINASAREINSSISQLGAYEAGLYVRTKSGATSITIFHLDNHEDLVRTLAHEMGHALGVEHSDDKDSFMYSRTADQPLRLIAGDVKAIATICKQ